MKMANDEIRSISSVTINIPKPRTMAKDKEVNFASHRTFKPRIERRLTLRRPSGYSLRRFSLPGDKLLKVKSIRREELLIPYKLYTKIQNQNIKKMKLGIKVNEKYKIISTDLKNRIHVIHPQDDVHALTDVDKHYFSCVDSRPLPYRVPLFKTITRQYNELLLVRYKIGCLNDCVLNIKNNYRREERTYEISLQRYKEQIKYLNEFISTDYQKSLECLKLWENVKEQLDEKIQELQNCAIGKFTIMSKLMGLDYMYSIQQKYGRFLYYLSPPSWRSSNRDFARSVEIEAKGFDLGVSNDEDTFTMVFDKLQRECASGLVKPVLYFTNPDELLDVFTGIEKQQLNHFVHVTFLRPHATSFNGKMDLLKNNMVSESTNTLSLITALEKLVQSCEEQCVELKSKFMKILHGLFYESVASPQVLQFRLHLDFCFEKLFGENPVYFDIVAVAKTIEKFHLDYSMKFDVIKGDKIKTAVKHYVETEKRKEKKAQYAATELRLFDRLERELLRDYCLLPSPHASASQKSAGNDNNDNRYSVSIKSFVPVVHKRQTLAEEQIEYLKLFTDWEENEDPAKFLQCLNEQP